MEKYFSKEVTSESRASSKHDHSSTQCLPSQTGECEIDVNSLEDGFGDPSDMDLGAGLISSTGKDELDVHIRGISSSAHNVEREDLMKQSENVEVVRGGPSDQTKRDYRAALETAIDCMKLMIRQGWIFHEPDEYSSKDGLFLELLKFTASFSGREDLESIVSGHPPKILQITSPDLEKDIVRAIVAEITLDIIGHLGDDFFAIFVDEAFDVEGEEHMAVILRYVDQEGSVEERLLGISRVPDSKALTFKMAIESMLVQHGLSMSRLRGLSYNGASNVNGEINGLKNLILAENPSAHYVHCSTHQLDSTVVSTAKHHVDVYIFFITVTRLINLVEAYCQGSNNSQYAKLAKALFHDEPKIGRGSYHELGHVKASNTYWQSHFKKLVVLDVMFSDVINVLEAIEDEKRYGVSGEAFTLLRLLENFEFVFFLKMMIRVLSITNALSNALEMKDQQILNAMQLVDVARYQLQEAREKGWDSFLDEVLSFCEKQCLDLPNMEDLRPKRFKAPQITNLHYYQVELFYTVLDLQLEVFNSTFDGVTTGLLNCVACLVPDDSFKGFNKQMVAKLATYYPNEFSDADIISLDSQLDAYIQDMQLDARFSNLKGIEELSRKMVMTKKHTMYPLVYLLVKLALILPVVATRAGAEKTFTEMIFMKEELQNRICDESMNDYLMAYIERDAVRHFDKGCILEYL
ncbi:unnamed protein product [Linum tenue]|uniref:DUF4371 domain-containing protein n=1 Tax=Linum tenue TaxID=586396 RepID=A0AAV0INF6_9ROSI|nr:unnamed protein product [Linum tenue]